MDENKTSEHPLVQLARATIEAYVREGRVIRPPAQLTAEMAAVSARRRRGPREMGTQPHLFANAISGSVNPPSGPITISTEEGFV